jgi:hypothetical protein
MVEGARWPGEAVSQRDQRFFGRSFFGVEGTEEQAADIHHFEGEAATAGGIEPGGGVLLSQGEELLALAHLRPWQRSFEELRGEDFHVRARRPMRPGARRA